MERLPCCKDKQSCIFAFDSLDYNSEPEQNDPIELFCRIKPLRDNIDSADIAMVATRLLSFFRLPQGNIFTMRSTQKEIFQSVAQPILQDLLAQRNTALFFYGTSDSGKTYTLIGDQANPGVLPRIIDTLFNTIRNCQIKKYILKSDKMNGFIVQSDKAAAQIRDMEHKLTTKLNPNFGDENKRFYNNDGVVVDGINSANLYAVFVSFILIYDESVYDLLDQSNGNILQAKVLKLDIRQKMCVENLVELEVMTSCQVHELYIYGYKRKRFLLDEKGNEEWKKAHSVFTLRLIQLPRKSKHTWNSQDDLITSQINLVDLAGMSVDISDVEVVPTNDTKNSLNNSIIILRICMQIYRNNCFRNEKISVPYYDSKLSLLFKDYFDGEGFLRMILCINPSVQYYDEASQAMLFANIDKRFAPENLCECVQVHSRASLEKPTTSKQANLVPEEKLPVVMKNFENIEASDAVISRLIKTLTVSKHSRLESTCEMKYIDIFRRKLTEMKRRNIAKKQDTRYMQRKWNKLPKLECDCDGDEEEHSLSRDAVECELRKQNMDESLNKRVDEYLKCQSEKLDGIDGEETKRVQKIKQILKTEDIESVQNCINDQLDVLKNNQELNK